MVIYTVDDDGILLNYWTTLKMHAIRQSFKIGLYYIVIENQISSIACITTNKEWDKELYEYVLLNETRHPCTRTCRKNDVPMLCKYQFKLEWYQTLSKACYNCPFNIEDCKRPHCIPGDGNKRPVLVVNRQMPGPSIEVCKGDEIIVDVENLLLGEGTSIHWHGYHQRDTPYMDGVPYVTQCPISSGSTFRYHFSATQAGTHFWHSHSGFQRTDGAFGSFIVRTPEEDDPHFDLYDYDLSSHTVIILDWGPEIGLAKFIAHHHSNGDNKAENILVNGLGRFKKFNTNNNETIYTPTARFLVERGYRYRFRVINAEFLNCPIEVSVDNHTITVISSDGRDFAPVEAESIVTYAGERFDFVLHADQPVGLYWMRFRGLMDCDQRFKSAHQAAVLQYVGASNSAYPVNDLNYDNAHKEGLQINALNKAPGENGLLSIVELESLEEWDVSLRRKPDYKFYISYDFYKLDNPHFHNPDLYGFQQVNDTKKQLLTPQLNHISLKLPPVPLLSGRDHLNTDKFCNDSTHNNCNDKYCECTHVLQVALNSVVELILIDKGFAYDANHPFHLHGYTFRVVGMGKLGDNVTPEKVEEYDSKELIARNLVNPVKKDTVTVPDGGYTILRFHASNPGYWLLHCHIEFHIEIGMALVFKVGDHKDMVPIPEEFPQCGNFMPTYKSINDTRFYAKNSSIVAKENAANCIYFNQYFLYLYAYFTVKSIIR
ncbi:hypothetical protein FQA39_LY01574 [Lamprigera yunnana]|nr:hypothetical protein FQA39_LY01574 [Lamprigera yunnana]